MKYAYVVFREMAGNQKAIKAYDMSKGYRCLTNCCKCCCSKRYENILNNYFHNKWLKVTSSDLPDEINYQNLGYSRFERRIRKGIIWLIALTLVILGMIGVVYFK